MIAHWWNARGLRLKEMLSVGLGIAAVAALGIPRFAAAQEATKKDDTLQEVVVTGSRLARSTFTTPNPVTVLDSKDIQNLGLVNVGDVLAQLPQNSNFFAANNVGLGNFNVGAQLANLRGLNPFFGTRTLTLIDTQRVVPTATGGGVDVTLIPSMLVSRTEVVTGGASAIYGSDAVAGVVNIILDKKLNGFKGQADYGQTESGDGGNSHFSIGYGSDLGDGRAHFIIGGEYQDTNAIGICSQERDWCKQGNALYTNTLYAGAPAGPALPYRPTACLTTSSGRTARSPTKASPGSDSVQRTGAGLHPYRTTVHLQFRRHCGHTLQSGQLRRRGRRLRIQPGGRRNRRRRL